MIASTLAIAVHRVLDPPLPATCCDLLVRLSAFLLPQLVGDENDLPVVSGSSTILRRGIVLKEK